MLLGAGASDGSVGLFTNPDKGHTINSCQYCFYKRGFDFHLQVSKCLKPNHLPGTINTPSQYSLETSTHSEKQIPQFIPGAQRKICNLLCLYVRKICILECLCVRESGQCVLTDIRREGIFAIYLFMRLI